MVPASTGGDLLGGMGVVGLREHLARECLVAELAVEEWEAHQILADKDHLLEILHLGSSAADHEQDDVLPACDCPGDCVVVLHDHHG